MSNLHLVDGADLSLSGAVRMQEFTTGKEGATLGGIEIRFSSASGGLDAPKATLRRREGSGHVLVAELAGPGKLATGDNEFLAPASTVLEADTAYAVRVQGGGSGIAVRGTADDGETGEDGWSIGDDSLRGAVGASSHRTVSAALMIRVSEARAGRRSDPFQPPLPPNLTLSETRSDDGDWTVGWSGAEVGDFYSHVELRETSPGGAVSTTTYYAAPGSAAISGKTAPGAYSYRARGCRNICSGWSGSLTVTYAPNSRPAVGAISDLTVARGSTATRTTPPWRRSPCPARSWRCAGLPGARRPSR